MNFNNMKRLFLLLFALLFTSLTAFACNREEEQNNKDFVNANDYGVLTTNCGEINSQNLQALLDSLSNEGGRVYIPAGKYEFASNGSQTIGNHCIKMPSNVSIFGDKDKTVLMPAGESIYGLDMFYFNDYLDINTPNYLENCTFENFVIDGANTSLVTYTSAGKGFMFNLFKNCHWKNVTVKNTDATGFGVDCPIDSTITNCVAINCGKAGVNNSSGASGFGIGFGYANAESITISNCIAQNNKKFGFFFEHQGRFNSKKYSATQGYDFKVLNCEASNNLYNFGGIFTTNTLYENCSSQNSVEYGFYFENSANSIAKNCSSTGDKIACFAITQTNTHKVNDISFENCVGNDSPCGVKIVAEGGAVVNNNCVKNCVFTNLSIYTVVVEGSMQGLSLTGNNSNINSNFFNAEIICFENLQNSWN